MLRRFDFRSPALPYAAIILLALGLRFVGLDWGAYHPDEWAISSAVYGLGWPSSVSEFLSSESPLNPHWFNYGSLPLYAYRAVSEIAADVRGVASIVPADVVLWRSLSGFADVVTLVLASLIARRLFGELAGLLTGLLYAVAVLPIQLSHFYTVDPLMVTFTTAGTGAALLFVSKGSFRWGYAAAALMGLAAATKASAILFVAPVVLAWAIVVFRAWSNETSRSFAPFARVVPAAVLMLATFAIGQPFAFLDWVGFRDDVLFQARMARGDEELPYTIQYLQTTPFMYHLRNLVVWGLGWPLGVAGLSAIAWLAARSVRRRDASAMLLALGVLVPVLLLGGQQVKFMRYLLPIYPLLVVAAAGLIVAVARSLWSRPGRVRWVAVAVVAAVVVPSGVYGVAFSNIYAGSHPVDRMGSWIETNVPAGATVALEAWDQGFPGSGRYSIIQVHPYDADDSRKVDHLAGVLDGADYVFLFSNRAYGALSRLPERYPLMRQYYRLLLTGQLGYEVVNAEATYPTLFGISFANQTLGPLGLGSNEVDLPPRSGPGTLMLGPADESFTVYDHPKTILLRKTEEISRDELHSRLAAAIPRLAVPVPPEFDSLLMMSETRTQEQREGGTWTSIFAQGGLPVSLPLVVWILGVQIIAVVGFPLSTRVFRALPDRGYLLGKILSLLLVAYVTWLLVALGMVPFARAAVIVAIVALAVTSASVGYANRRELGAFVRARWRLLLAMETLFLVMFVALMIVRASNPDLWHEYRGGEKPMDLAYLTAVVRSTHLPPYDPWFAGGFLNYYYFGQFFVAVLIHLTGIVPEVAFNLAVPLLWALTLGASASVVFNLVEASNVRPRLTRSGVLGAVGAGIGAAFLVGLAGNLDGGIQVFQRFRDGVDAGVIGSLTNALSGNGFDYWRSSRMIDVPGSISITEFPFFTFLFADLHAHLIALPMTLLAVGLSLAAALAVHGRFGAFTRLSPLAALGLTVGALLATNAWDFPPYVALGSVAIFVAYVSRGTGVIAASAYSAAALGALVFIGFAAFAPYHASNVAFYTDIVRSPEQTPLRSYAAIFGLPLFILSSALIVTLWKAWFSRDEELAGYEPQTRPLVSMGWLRWDRRWLGAGAIVVGTTMLTVPAWVFGYQVVAINVVLLVAVAAAVLVPRSRLPTRLAFAAAGLALLLIAGVDLYAVDDHLVRMNTIFRVYIQAWVLLGLAAGFFIWTLSQHGAFRRVLRSPLKVGFVSGLAVLVFAAGVYPVLGTRARLADRFEPLPRTLDGLAYTDSATYRDIGDAIVHLDAEVEGIQWLRLNVSGSPVVAEAVVPPPPNDVTYFRYLSRVAVYTGLPVVVGWPWHQTQQRGIGRAEPLVQTRLSDLRRLYSAGDVDTVRGIIDKYEIEYVIVGQLERLYYPANGLAVFDQMTDLERNDINDAVVIYRVRQPQIALG